VELFSFARFRAKEGQEGAVAIDLRATAAATRAEPGCLAMALFHYVRGPRLFWLHSRWLDEAALEIHVGRPRVAAFVERVQPLIDHPLDVTRTHLMAYAQTPLCPDARSGSGRLAPTVQESLRSTLIHSYLISRRFSERGAQAVSRDRQSHLVCC